MKPAGCLAGCSPGLQQTWAESVAQLESQQSEKLPSQMQNLFRVRPNLENRFLLSFSNPRALSLGFLYQFHDVCSKYVGTEENISPRFHCHKHYCTLTATTWCHRVSQTQCLPTPWGIYRCSVLSPQPPWPQPPSTSEIATLLTFDLRRPPVGAAPSSWSLAELCWPRDSLPVPCATVP